ncbi:hypothetical protein SAMN04488069_10223 [Hymenobacter psychrophilus]|uniref:Uncharacterized protein n=1 Tax=Hymenobacter psychrophilus TaxID=651662 RepID=A0A1H3CK28_9BACT|nr:hypothetical protein SAMN04488069_10223 [Hymenobacter psychrophilus]
MYLKFSVNSLFYFKCKADIILSQRTHEFFWGNTVLTRKKFRKVMNVAIANCVSDLWNGMFYEVINHLFCFMQTQYADIFIRS